MANTYNALNTSTIAPFVSKQVDAKLKQAVKVSIIPSNERTVLFQNDPSGGTTTTLNGTSAGAANVFNQQIIPTLDASNPGIWQTVIAGAEYADPDYGILIFKGNRNSNVDVETLVSCDTAATNLGITTQLYLNGAAVDANYTGGRGYYNAVNVTIFGNGKVATARPTVVNGNITAITPINRGTGYSAATVGITGSGIEATATASINGAGGIDVITITPQKPCPSGIQGIFQTVQDKHYEVRRLYNLDLVPNDRLELRMLTTTSGTTASSKIFQVKLQVLRPIVNYSQ